MDVVSLAAILGLVCAGRNLSLKSDESKTTVEFYTDKDDKKEQLQPEQNDNMSRMTGTFTGGEVSDPAMAGPGVQTKRKDVQPSFGDVAFMKHVNGEPVQDFRDRPYVSGQMNNLGPVPKDMVGPGLGIGPNVPAYGGYQQLFRVDPTNVGAYKLTTLPGRINPGGDTTGGMPGKIGKITNYGPGQSKFLPVRRPNVGGRGQGQGGALTGQTGQANYMRTKRQTNRSETTLRNDGLEFRPAQRVVQAEPLAQDPTRNKGDRTTAGFMYNTPPTPGIASFAGGYTQSPAVQYMNSQNNSNANMEKYGLRPEDRRGQKAREGNAGRMNVRGSAVQQGGMITTVRSDCNRMDGRLNPVNGSWSQNYVQDQFYQLNQYKGNRNPRASNRALSTADRVLARNPLAQSVS